MDFDSLIPIVAIAATAAVLLALIRMRTERQSIEANSGENVRLTQENEALRRTIGRLEERMAVLEAIATDPAERTAREIESLRQD